MPSMDTARFIIHILLTICPWFLQRMPPDGVMTLASGTSTPTTLLVRPRATSLNYPQTQGQRWPPHSTPPVTSYPQPPWQQQCGSSLSSSKSFFCQRQWNFQTENLNLVEQLWKRFPQGEKRNDSGPKVDLSLGFEPDYSSIQGRDANQYLEGVL